MMILNGITVEWMRRGYIMKYNDDDDIGYILEVDLDYPKELHDLHKDYPLAPEIMCINESMLSQVQKDIHKYYYGKDASDEVGRVSKFCLLFVS